MTLPEDVQFDGTFRDLGIPRSETTDHIVAQAVEALDFVSAAFIGEQFCELCVRQNIGVPVFMLPEGEAHYISTITVNPSLVPQEPEITDVRVHLQEPPKVNIGRLLYARGLNKILFIPNSDLPGFFCEFKPSSSSDTSESAKEKSLATEARYARFMGQYLSGRIQFTADHAAYFGQSIMAQLPGEASIHFQSEYVGDKAGMYEQQFLEIFGQVKLEAMMVKDMALSLQTLLKVLSQT